MVKNGRVLVAMGVALLFSSASFASVTPQQKCQQAKLKAQGKYQACIKKNVAGVIGGKDDAAATCQTKFTAALEKADAKATAKMTSCRYLDNGDGTVSDLNTGLVWEKKTASGIHDVNTTYTWAISDTKPDGTVFTDFLGTLNRATTSNGTDTPTACFAGHCDWRLPTIQELKGIVDLTAAGCDGGSPCIDPIFLPSHPPSSFDWSATTDDDNSDYGWVVLFSDGSAQYLNKPTIGHARAVRGGL